MKTNLTELVFILDRSGSMGGLESDTIGGFNALLTKQKAEEGACWLTTVLFDDTYEVLHDRLDLAGVSPITAQEYFVRGSTALLDAIGKTIEKVSNVQTRVAPEYRADRVLFVITTDGMENASRAYSCARVKKLIEMQKAEYGWEFVFLGANINAVAVAERVGIDQSRAQSFHNDKEGVALNFSVVSKLVSKFRDVSAPCEVAGWNEEIEADFKARS